jgi:hypothetical protein
MEKPMAVLTLNGASKLTPSGRRKVAWWMFKIAWALMVGDTEYTSRHRERYGESK